MQTILGSGGSIGVPLAKELSAYTDKIRLVSRNPKKVNDSDELFQADLRDVAQIDNAIAGSEVVYLTIAFEYNIRVWQREWPKLMRNVITSCKNHRSRLVFFDNVYMYDRDFMNNLTEETPVRPTSKKGRIRAEIAGMILDAVKKKELTALIARSADFYGPRNSVLVEMVVKNLDKNKKAMWFANANKIHTFTSAEDAAKATAMLGNSPDAFNQVWHLPTSRFGLTGRQWIELIAAIMHKEPKAFVIPVWMLSVMGIVVPVFREFREMAYQFDRDYIFNSNKFEKRFSFTPRRPEDGMKALIASLQKKPGDR
jgi:nucleoside-diphosphate-sugar epimerase